MVNESNNMFLNIANRRLVASFPKGAGLLLWVVWAAVVFGMAGGCSPAHYKEQADDEVYEIIDSKWHDSLGQKANYTISEVAPSPNDIRVEKAVPPSGVLNLARAVGIATAHNRDYQSRKEQLYLTALGLTLDRHEFARQWFGTIDSDYVRDSEDESLGYEVESGFDQLLADGAAVSASIAVDWVRFLTGDPQRSLGSVLSATISQPLLRGRGRRIAQEGLTQSERDVLYEMRAFSRFRKEFVVSVVSDYHSVLQKRNEVTNAENNYERVAESKSRLEAEAGVGRRPRFEVDQAQQDVLKAKDGLVRAQEEYEQALDEFKIVLAFETDAEIELDQNELKSLEAMGITEPEYTLDAALETGLVGRLDLASSADKIDDAVRKVMVAADGLGAELNLSAGANVGSSGDTDFTRLQFHNGTYSLGLDSDLPFDRKAERNAYRQALIDLQQGRREHQENVARVKLDIRQAYRQLRETQERYRIQKNSLELAWKRVDSTAMFLKTGRAQTRDLLESQDALLEAENELTDALVGHTIAKLNFFRDIGVLQVRADGMWEQQARINQGKER
ncbi:MAG: TolC family protein [Planctomycetota bacterium]|jgi:outer membrane protein TolC